MSRGPSLAAEPTTSKQPPTSGSTVPVRDITRVILAVLFIILLMSASFLVLRPFLTSLVWASMLAVTTWPFMLHIQRWLWGKRALAALVMVGLLLLVLFVPLSLAIASIIARADDIVRIARGFGALTFPPPPEWVARIPLLGVKLATEWQEVASLGPRILAESLAPHARSLVSWSLAEVGNVGLILVQFLLTVVITAVLYIKGEQAANGVIQFANRLAGKYGKDAVILAGKAVRGVAAGVVVTALIQAVGGGLGLALSGVPAAVVLTAVMFVLCVAQLGPLPVLVPAVAWLFWTDQVFWGTVMVGWALVIGLIDNVLRPLLIKKGADLPLLLIFVGVIGGLLAFGVIGLFVGPVILAVTYTLLKAWVIGEERAAREL